MSKRKSGLLMHLTSLPGAYGHGTFGEEALRFGKKLVEAGFSYWQILPIGQPSAASPYLGLSAFAGYVGLIDPRELADMGLLRPEELKQFEYTASPYVADYEFVEKNSRNFLNLAYSRINDWHREKISKFKEENTWLRAYAIFSIAREQNNKAGWWEWSDRALAAADEEAILHFEVEYSRELECECFKQWIFSIQWQNLKRQLNELGLGIFGDIPFYVAWDSADVWYNRQYFDLDEQFRPREIAGVPPDYFSEDGQLWGFPIYNWSNLHENGYDWWLERIGFELKRYDLLRIDHFRGFSAYWAVPFGSETARYGKWYKGPAMHFFQAVIKKYGTKAIVAEDLGVMDDDLADLLKQTGFPGMKVLQFALTATFWSQDLPHDYVKNSCAYTGTHDNNTMLGWLWEADEAVRQHALAYIGFPEREDWGKGGEKSISCRSFIRTVWSSVANMAIAPIQDFLGYGSDAKMNTPGVAERCWTFRIDMAAIDRLDTTWIKELNRLYGRDNSYTED